MGGGGGGGEGEEERWGVDLMRIRGRRCGAEDQTGSEEVLLCRNEVGVEV